MASNELSLATEKKIGKKIMDETRVYKIQSIEKGWMVVMESDLFASVARIIFADTKEGSFGIRINDLKDLKPKMEEAFAMKDRLVFIDIQVDTSEHVYPMQIKDGSMRDMWLNRTERT